ncbi:MAG: homoserine O-acetyltransferase, partial [Candidatus Kentron sp. G]
PADVKCLSLLYLYVGRYPRNNASRNTDTLVNLHAYSPSVVTTGPATTNPATGVPYGMDFPLVTIRDFVNVQKALLESLGITSLRAVMGASMGAMQAIEWGSAYPEMVERIIPVIGTGEASAFAIASFNIWSSPIMLDSNWNGGDYYSSEPPMDGLREALKITILNVRSWEWAEQFGRSWAEEGKDPAAAFENQYAIEATFDSAAEAFIENADPNHWLYLAKACQNFMAGHGNSLEEGLAAIEDPVLLIYSPEDLLFFPEQVRATGELIEADGTPPKVKYAPVPGDSGHMNGIYYIDQAAERIANFLAWSKGDGGR